MGYFLILLTIITSIIAIIEFLKRKSTKLYYLKEQEIHFQEDLLENFENLSITYNNEPVSDKLTLIKGSILCYGIKDIENQANILEVFNNDIAWLNFKITNKSQGLNVSCSIENNKAIISFGYIKSKEFFQFEAIVNRNNVSQHNLKLNFFHRILNIPSIVQINKDSVQNGKRLFLIGLFVIILPSYIVNLSSKFESYDTNVFDSNTKEQLINTDLKYSAEFRKLLSAVNDDYWGYELYFVPSKNYKLTYRAYEITDIKNKTVNIYFTRTDYGNLAMAILGVLFIVVGAFFVIVSITAYNYEKYFKNINSPTAP